MDTIAICLVLFLGQPIAGHIHPEGKRGCQKLIPHRAVMVSQMAKSYGMNPEHFSIGCMTIAEIEARWGYSV